MCLLLLCLVMAWYHYLSITSLMYRLCIASLLSLLMVLAAS